MRSEQNFSYISFATFTHSTFRWIIIEQKSLTVNLNFKCHVTSLCLILKKYQKKKPPLYNPAISVLLIVSLKADCLNSSLQQVFTKTNWIEETTSTEK